MLHHEKSGLHSREGARMTRVGARGEIRTHTVSLPEDFESLRLPFRHSGAELHYT